MHMGNKKTKPKSLGPQDKKNRKKDGSRGPFSLRSAFLITVLLTVFLWWLPVLGQMIAGYVGGRRSGSAAKGIVATGSAVGIFVIAALLLSSAGFSFIDAQERLTDTMLAGFPALTDLVTTMSGYASSFFLAFGTIGSACAIVAATTVVFGMTGGILAGQARLEREYRTPSASAPAAFSARSMDAYRNGRSVGFGSFGDYAPVHASQTVTAATGKPLVRRAAARNAPEPQPAAEIRSPLSSVLEMTGNVQPRERPAPVVQKDDFEYI
jgi:hypothetical protein